MVPSFLVIIQLLVNVGDKSYLFLNRMSNHAPSQSAGAGEAGMSSRMEPPCERHATEIRSTRDVARGGVWVSYIYYVF